MVHIHHRFWWSINVTRIQNFSLWELLKSYCLSIQYEYPQHCTANEQEFIAGIEII